MDLYSDDKIARLLRLKRYEQPPPDYFENFLHEFHRRQRERHELFPQPFWRICVECAEDFAPVEYPFLGTRRHRGNGRVRRSSFNQAVSATGHYSGGGSPGVARSTHAIDYRKRI